MIRSILSIIGFYIAYWICKSIFYSFLTNETTIDFITKGEWIIAGVLSVGICAGTAQIESKGQTCASIMLALTFIAAFIPFSWGIVVLYNLALIGCIGASAYEE